MRPADNKLEPHSSELPQQDGDAHAEPPAEMPIVFATAVLEKLIVDRDAAAVRRIVTAGRRH